jgi:hypothetical protein
VAETILAGKEVKEFSLSDGAAIFTFPGAVFPWFFKYFFVRNRPGDACNRNGQHKQPDNLFIQFHSGIL